jgi:hypothetical protein
VCTGHIGTLTAKAAKNAKNSSVCAGARQRQLVPGQDVKAATRLGVQEDQRNQHQQRAEQRVQEELERRVDLVGPTPDADDQVHRDQRGLKEHIEQNAVERAEHADHQAAENEERTHVLVDALGDDLPAGNDDHHG